MLLIWSYVLKSVKIYQLCPTSQYIKKGELTENKKKTERVKIRLKGSIEKNRKRIEETIKEKKKR